MKHQRIATVHRLFFALRPDPVTARRTDVFAEGLGEGAARIRPAHQHMTLAITNDYQSYPEEVAERLLRAGDRVAAAPFGLSLDQLVGSYSSVALRPRIRVPQLVALYRATEGRCGRVPSHCARATASLHTKP
jgi:2'-5' RNA ligase